MKTFRQNRTCLLWALELICISVIPSCDNSGDVSRVDNRHQDSETVSPDKVARRYSDDYILKHDLAVSLWFVKQYFSMNVISFDEQNEVRLQSYMEFSKFDDKSQILDCQLRAINEFIASYQGSDKQRILEKWLITQTEAAEVLRKFLDEVQMVPKNVSISEKQRTECERVLDKQKRYLDIFKEYRDLWKQRQ